MKIIFMGTPEFAAESLKGLIEAGHEISLVVTQPDREKGRGKKLQMSPVKELALEKGLEVFQPERIKTEEALGELFKYEADIYVVAAFGQILSREILEHPRYGCINVHASLLPLYRGAAPIQWSIIDGRKESGVTIMQMAEGLDTGDMIARTIVPIEAQDTGDSLHDKLAAAGARLLVLALKDIEEGRAVFEKQRDEDSCYAKKLTKELGRLDFNLDCLYLDRLIRGLNSWPGAYTGLDGKTLKIWKARPLAGEKRQAGEIFGTKEGRLCIGCKDGAIEVEELQLEGKKRMDTGSFLRGYQIEEGRILA